MKNRTNMYKLSVVQWNPFAGCRHNCVYCKSSFQRQVKRWAKKNCPSCFNFEPHAHPERLKQRLPRTKYMQFIFTCSSGDIACCDDTQYLKRIMAWIRSEPDKAFLLQSKDPTTFTRIATFPGNLILGVTLETNRDELYEEISQAPKPSQRYKDFLEVKHGLKMVTVEPVINFDLNVMTSWIGDINPCMVWLGYDSGKNRLPEPRLEEVKNLYWELGCRGFTVILKKIRKAWNEE